MKVTTIKDVLSILDTITRGRVVTDISDLFGNANPFVVTKSSNIPGKAITETPGLVWGQLEREVRRIALCMTLTEVVLELAGALEIDLVIAHHPVADAASSGGTPLGGYCDLHGISVIELHEAYHGLHHGIPYLHGYEVVKAFPDYAGVVGNGLWIGRTLEEVKQLGDIVARISRYMAREADASLLETERRVWECPDLMEASVACPPRILVGQPDSPVDNIIHILPHGGFTPQHLEMAKLEFPDADTVLCSGGRTRPSHPLVKKAEELEMNFVLGNTHALEILENWVALGKALKSFLPAVEITVCRDRVTAYPLDVIGGGALQVYAEMIADRYLVGG